MSWLYTKFQQNIICMGLNYEDHIKESEKVFQNIKRPKYPIIFTSTLNVIHHMEKYLYEVKFPKIDWESELAIIMGKPGIHIKKGEAYDYVWVHSSPIYFSKRYSKIINNSF